MPMRRLRRLRSEEDGFALIEVLVSALIVVLVTAAVVQTLTATGRASTEQRHQAQAFSVAQEDQARLRSMQISTLQQGLEPRTVTVAGTPFTVTSTAIYVSDKTGTTQCGGEARADYVRIGSSVTWPTMHEGQAPVKIESIVSPTSGSVDSTSGGIAVTAKKSRKSEVFSGLGLSGTGPATFSGATNSEGCALFGGEPTGKYTITPKPPGSGWVAKNGEPPQPFTVSVVGGTTATKELNYDLAGSLKVLFSVRPREGGPVVAAKADSFMASNPEIAARSFGNPGTGLLAELESTKTLYPFETGYSVYGGSCTAVEGPQPEGAAKSFVTVPVGGPAEVMVRLPALYLTVKRSTGGTLAEQTAVSGAKVTLTDLNCKNSGGNPVVREYKTTAIGSLGEKVPGIPTTEAPGVPTGEYEICASKAGRRITAKTVVKSVEGTSVQMDLASAGSTVGEC